MILIALFLSNTIDLGNFVNGEMGVIINVSILD
jgi:hypothetical protein